MQKTWKDKLLKMKQKWLKIDEKNWASPVTKEMQNKIILNFLFTKLENILKRKIPAFGKGYRIYAHTCWQRYKMIKFFWRAI